MHLLIDIFIAFIDIVLALASIDLKQKFFGLDFFKEFCIFNLNLSLAILN